MKEYIVIGAGILGASAAYHLANSGASVTVIDRKDEGQATDAAAGIICPWLSQRRNKAWYALAKNGAAYYSTLIPQLESDGEIETGYKRVGAISIHTDETKLVKMKERAEARRGDAPEIGTIRQMAAEETSSLFPPLDASFGAVNVSGAARVNGRALRNALLHAAKKHGAKFIYGDAALAGDGAQVTGVKVGDVSLAGDCILVTAGAWADKLLSPLSLHMELSAQKAQIIHLKIDGKQTGEWPVVMPPNDQYILAFDDGRIVIGATHENEHDFDLNVTAGGMHEVLSKALSVAPGLADSTFLETRVGFRPYTPNFLPIIGKVPGYDNLLIANGLGASGLTVGPFLGTELAKLALGEPLSIDLGLYDVAAAIHILEK